MSIWIKHSLYHHVLLTIAEQSGAYYLDSAKPKSLKYFPFSFFAWKKTSPVKTDVFEASLGQKIQTFKFWAMYTNCTYECMYHIPGVNRNIVL